jgi:hypothetical protein
MTEDDFIPANYYLDDPNTDDYKLSLEVLEECAFIESGLVAHGFSEKLDDYIRESIVRYGRYLLKYQHKLSDEDKVQI